MGEPYVWPMQVGACACSHNCPNCRASQLTRIHAINGETLSTSVSMTPAPQLLQRQQASHGRSRFATPVRRLRFVSNTHALHASDGPSPSGRHCSGDSPALQADLLDVGGAAKLITAAAIVCHFAVNTSAARAEDRPWKPRRHHRRLGERYTDAWAEELVEVWNFAWQW